MKDIDELTANLRRRFADPMKPAVVSIVIAVFAICIAWTSAAEPLVTIAPAQLDLHPSAPNDNTSWQRITLAILNRTARKWRFSNFYDSWEPILVFEKQPLEWVRMGGGRDVTFQARPADYPYLAPGERTEARAGCQLIRSEKKLVLHLTESTGGWRDCEVAPGHYKLCVSYCATLDGPLFRSATERVGVKAAEVWSGWQMSNWIDVIIHAK